MRIAIDCRMYGASQFSGIGTYIQRLTDELFKLDKENEYILFMRQEEFDKFTPPSERVTKVLADFPHYSYSEQVKFPFLLMKHKIDLIHYPHFNSPILYWKRSICTIHDTTPFRFPGHKARSGWRKLAYQIVFRFTMLKAKAVLTVSANTKRDIVSDFGVNADKVKVTHLGVDERFHEVAKSAIINKVTEKYGIKKPYLLNIGVWRSHKNVEGLVKAFNLLKNKHKIPHQLVLGGREDLHYTNVRNEIESSPFKEDIITPGFIADEDLPALYAGADAFVLPSFIEGFGLICIEAQSQNCPVVSTDTSSLPEILNDSALLFDPNNTEEIANKINLVISNQEIKTKLINAGQQNIKRFSWQKCAEETLNTYKNQKL